MAKWTWLSGLASDLNAWEDDLSLVDSDAEHTFVSYADVIASVGNIFALPVVAKADVLVGMDFSALVMLKNLSKRPKGQRWVMLAPILDFCHGEDAWPQKQVLLMAREVKKMPKNALQDLLELFGPADEFHQELWMETALKMGADKIAAGFEYLATEKIEEPVDVPRCEVRFGKEDAWITAPAVDAAKKLLNGANVLTRPKAGHWAISLIA